VGRTHAGAGEWCEEEGTEERNHCGLTAGPHSPPPALLGAVEEVEELAV